MCIGKAFIIRKGQRHPDYLMDSNNHAPLVESLGLRDDKPVELKNFIRVEMLPLGSLTSEDPKDWQFSIDEIGRLPDWFEEKISDWEDKCKNLLTKVIVPSWIKDGVGGSLDLRDTKITTVPKTIKNVIW